MRKDGWIDEALRRREVGYDSFHTPGHKGTLCPEDTTELGRGGKFFPADAVTLAERDTAKLYGVPRLRYLTGGSSIGIKAALLAFRGQTVLYADGVHVSFAQGCMLADIRALPIGKGDTGRIYTCGCETLPPPPSVAEVEEALRRHPEAVAVFITSPDYLGRCADTEIAALCRRYGVKLLVDGAHGAHFAFAPDLASRDFCRLADVCNMSAHKTLGAYTQTALLAMRDETLADIIDENLSLLGTTSPNYVWLARLEDAVAEAAESTREYARLRAFRDSLAKDIPLLENDDYTRLCVLPPEGDADALESYLWQNGIAPEAVIAGTVVLILTPYDDDAKLQRLRDVLRRAYGRK